MYIATCTYTLPGFLYTPTVGLRIERAVVTPNPICRLLRRLGFPFGKMGSQHHPLQEDQVSVYETACVCTQACSYVA